MLGFLNSDLLDISLIPSYSFEISERDVMMSYLIPSADLIQHNNSSASAVDYSVQFIYLVIFKRFRLFKF
jgi:hypothetical protein